MGKFIEGFKSVAYGVTDGTRKFVTEKVMTKNGAIVTTIAIVGGTIAYVVGKKHGKKVEQRKHGEFKKEVIEFCSALGKTEKSPKKEEEKNNEESK